MREKTMAQAQPLVKKTLCALCVSHYQLDVLDEWFDRWDSVIIRSQVPVQGQGSLSAFDLWHVEGPPEAFAELELEFFAHRHLPLAADAAKKRINIV